MTGFKHRFTRWFFEGLKEPKRRVGRQHGQDTWYRVMCLTGVDYFSSLRYQPGIAYLIMSAFLLSSAVVTALIIPPEFFDEGGPANGRALAYLAHRFLGENFGSLYDLSTIAILWFAGASALAGLLNLVPRYLPRYGMAPEWARALRPNAVFFTIVAFVVTWLFRASVDAQAGAYATGVLVLMTSASLAVTLAVWSKGWWQRLAYLSVTIAFTYTTTANCIGRPEGLHIASFFIAAIVVSSIVSRALRSTELRIKEVVFDDSATKILDDYAGKTVRLISPEPGHASYDRAEKEARDIHNIPDGEILFLQVYVRDPSEFIDEVLEVKGANSGRHRILSCDSPAVANALAATLLKIRDTTAMLPHLYLSWAESDPFQSALKFLFLGQGEVGPMTREVLRQAEPDPESRPKVHVT